MQAISKSRALQNVTHSSDLDAVCKILKSMLNCHFGAHPSNLTRLSAEVPRRMTVSVLVPSRPAADAEGSRRQAMPVPSIDPGVHGSASPIFRLHYPAALGLCSVHPRLIPAAETRMAAAPRNCIAWSRRSKARKSTPMATRG